MGTEPEPEPASGGLMVFFGLGVSNAYRADVARRAEAFRQQAGTLPEMVDGLVADAVAPEPADDDS